MKPSEPTPDAGTPAAEVRIDSQLVQSLLIEQHPELAALEIRPLTNGWDNSIWRLGEELAVRLPRRAQSAPLVRNEQRWLPEIARRLSVPVPEPLRIGEPSSAYPWYWSVVRWIEGVAADREPLRASAATTVGRFLADLHTPAPEEAPANPYRGIPICHRAESFATRLRRLSGFSSVDLDHVQAIFQRARETPIDVERIWLHGDLHPKNVIGRRGRLAAVVDWGDLTAGDPATDLAAVWMLFANEAHPRFWRAYGRASESTQIRARGWAAFFGVVLLDTGIADDPPFAAVGRATLERICADPP